MPNPRLVQDDYVQTASFTLRVKDIKFLDKVAKKCKNRSEALRLILDEAQFGYHPFTEHYPTAARKKK
jgi:hypothetical protein